MNRLTATQKSVSSLMQEFDSGSIAVPEIQRELVWGPDQTGDISPWQYLDNFSNRETRKAHFIPENKDLWKPEKFEAFLAERRRLLAAGMNSLLKTLF